MHLGQPTGPRAGKGAMARSFAYLAAVDEWATRRVLAWCLSISMEVDFAVLLPFESASKRSRRHRPNAAGPRFSIQAKAARFSDTRSVRGSQPAPRLTGEPGGGNFADRPICEPRVNSHE